MSFLRGKRFLDLLPSSWTAGNGYQWVMMTIVL